MCDVVTALKVGTAIYSYQNQKAIAKGKATTAAVIPPKRSPLMFLKFKP